MIIYIDLPSWAARARKRQFLLRKGTKSHSLSIIGWLDNKYLDIFKSQQQDSFFRQLIFFEPFISCSNSALMRTLPGHLHTLRSMTIQRNRRSPSPRIDAGSSETLCQHLQPQPAPLGDEPQVFYHLQLGFENNQISISPLVFLSWLIPDGRLHRSINKQWGTEACHCLQIRVPVLIACGHGWRLCFKQIAKGLFFNNESRQQTALQGQLSSYWNEDTSVLATTIYHITTVISVPSVAFKAMLCNLPTIRVK